MADLGDLSHEARRFRTIMWTFERNLTLLFDGTGLKTLVDTEALAEAFSKWRQAFDKAKHLAGVNRHDFVIYAAGMMLKELVAAAPLRTGQNTGGAAKELSRPMERWPEGYAYTSFCLSVASAILKEMGEEEPRASGLSDDPAFWDSFRENSLESPATAVAFFDLVCGNAPNWEAPDVPWLRRSFRNAQKKLAS
ncbi:MAG: hypothetical protein ACKVP5_16220 [Aestuariivirga sp.]